MAVLQSTYADRIGSAYEGMIANTEPCTIISRVVEETNGIAFGAVAIQGTADNQVSAAAASGVFRGITVLDKALDALATDTYPDEEVASIMTRGVVWVTAGADGIAAGEPVYWTDAGVWTNVSTSNNAVPNAVFDSSGDTNDLVKIRLS